MIRSGGSSKKRLACTRSNLKEGERGEGREDENWQRCQLRDGWKQMADQIPRIKRGVTQPRGAPWREMCINFSSFLISECLRSGFSAGDIYIRMVQRHPVFTSFSSLFFEQVLFLLSNSWLHFVLSRLISPFLSLSLSLSLSSYFTVVFFLAEKT